jgi:hypothetical protein
MSSPSRPRSGDWWGNAAVVAILLLVGGVLLLTTLGGPKHSAQRSGAHNPAQKQARAPAATPSAAVTTSAKLPNQVRAFLETYFTTYPHDTAASRRQRLASLRPALSQSFLDKLDLGFSTGTKADQSRSGKTIKAQAPTSDMIGEPVNGDAQRMQFTSNVTFTQTGSGSVSSPYGFTVTTVWQYGAGYWQIVQFKSDVS